MSVKPILFNTEMVKAIQDGRKTVTRRVIKEKLPKDPQWGYTFFTPQGKISCRGIFADGYGEAFYKLPYKPGDILYVRETWQYAYDIDDNDYIIEDTGRYLYYADNPMPFTHWLDSDTGEHKDYMPWRPSIHMPKEAARIWLKVTNVRVERLQDMTCEDMLMEGVDFRERGAGSRDKITNNFIKIHDSTIKKKDLDKYGWNANPWVWVIEFERCEKPEGVTG